MKNGFLAFILILFTGFAHAERVPYFEVQIAIYSFDGYHILGELTNKKNVRLKRSAIKNPTADKKMRTYKISFQDWEEAEATVH